MVKTTRSVTVAYLSAKNQVSDLENIAGNLEKQKRKLAEQRADVHRVWSGENADCYCAKMLKKENELSSIIADIRNIASTVQVVTENTYKADMKAIQLAKVRSKK